MAKRGRSPIQQAAQTVGDTLGDVKVAATVGAVKGAASETLSTLGSKVASITDSNGDLAKNTRKAQKQAANALAQTTKNAQKAAKEAQKNVQKSAKETQKNAQKSAKEAQKNAQKSDISDKAADAGGTAAGLLQALGNRTGEVAQGMQKNVSGNGLNINLDASDLPRLLRGVTLLATGFGTLFAPGSPLDASRPHGVNTDELSTQARKGIDSASDATQQRIKSIVDLTKDALSSLSDALQSGIETAESSLQQALDDTEENLTKATGQVADQAKGALPQPKKSGGSFRFLFFGLVIGGAVAFISSPLSGPLGERVRNLRRDLGLGGDQGDDSQYWPSPPQESATSSASATSSTGTTPASTTGTTTAPSGTSSTSTAGTTPATAPSTGNGSAAPNAETTGNVTGGENS